MSTSEPLWLRPHHGLCIRFFQGKGYDAAFICNMQHIIRSLETDPLLRLTCACDVLCAACPFQADSICQSADKVLQFDRQVLALCGLPEGTELRWSAFSALVRERILEAGCLSSVCSSCQWYPLCSVSPVLR